MTIDHLIIEANDPAAATDVATALGVGARVRARASEAPTSGFRGFTLSLVVPGPDDVDALVDAASDAGATVHKPASKSLWGYGGALRSPDGTIWTLASSSKKRAGSPTGRIDTFVLQLGVDDVAESKRFYVDQGLTVTKSYGRRYVELAPPTSPVAMALIKRRALAKTAGVSPEGSGSHRLVIAGDLGPVTDPDGFAWEPSSA